MKKIIVLSGLILFLAASCNKQALNQANNQAQNQDSSNQVTPQPPAPNPKPAPVPTPTPTPKPTPTPTPITVKILSMNPLSGPIGTYINMTGSGFTSTGNTVHFGLSNNQPDAMGTIYPNISSSNNAIVFQVPAQDNPLCPVTAPYCPIRAPIPITPGTYNLFISNANGTSNIISFTVTQ
jgi:hypothetical protein